MGNLMELAHNWWFQFDQSYMEPLNVAERSDSPRPHPKNHTYQPPLDRISESEESEEDTIEL